MGIDMSNFKVIYNDQVFNAVSVIPTVDFNPEKQRFAKPKFIDLWFVNEDGELTVIQDEAWKFKFVRR
jgi:hypothetical protein